MATPSRVTIAKPNRPNGVLSVPASATQKKPGASTDRRASQSSLRLKIVIRRLPPGLTQQEFEEAIGDEWRVGAGRVSWQSYKPGKISKDLEKPSRPSRAYLHLTRQEHINSLSEKVRSTTFADSKGSTKDSRLIGPPSVEFAPYGRVPSGRPRKDARQGTIDQDPEFMSFLESLTNPVTKSASAEQEEGGAKSKEKVTVTPLVQFLKDKKASKAKEAAAAKGAKQSRPEKDNKANDSKATSQATQSPKKRSAQAVKVEQAARDAVKVLNKQAANTKGAAATQPASKPQSVTPKVAPNSSANAALANKQRERGNVKAAAQILQRDLGLAGNARGRGAKNPAQNAAPKHAGGNNQATNKPAATPAPTPQTPQPTAPNKPAAQTPGASSPSSQPVPTQPPTGPAANRTSTKAAGGPSPQPASSRPAAPQSTSTQAFLKHANPSQGVTEPLLQEAFKEFGTVNNVEIDKKKGFAYVDFAEPESLQKAIKASPIKVAQGQVQVHERKTGQQLQAKNALRPGGSPAVNNNIRGGPMINQNHARGGGMGPGVRGGHANARGGPPLGPRGGHVRGRGAMGRGGSNMPHTNQAKIGASGLANTPATTATAPAGSSAAPTTSTSAPTKAAPTESSGG